MATERQSRKNTKNYPNGLLEEISRNIQKRKYTERMNKGNNRDYEYHYKTLPKQILNWQGTGKIMPRYIVLPKKS